MELSPTRTGYSGCWDNSSARQSNSTSHYCAKPSIERACVFCFFSSTELWLRIQQRRKYTGHHCCEQMTPNWNGKFSRKLWFYWWYQQCFLFLILFSFFPFYSPLSFLQTEPVWIVRVWFDLSDPLKRCLLLFMNIWVDHKHGDTVVARVIKPLNTYNELYK